MTEAEEWAHGERWTGNADANAIRGIAKPRVLHVDEGGPGRRRLRVEIMTRLPGTPCSPTDVLRAAPSLSDAWWGELRAALHTLSRTPTERAGRSPGHVVDRIRGRFGIELDPAALRWETVHGDLHWANLFARPFGIVDWDHWGRGLVGEDAATLYCASSLQPDTAERVLTTFADVLDSEAGRPALLLVLARFLHRAEDGDHPDLVPALHRLADRLMA
ncbi:hypothetical protein [Actinomadura atramentaria]|uniref:hypothetical protein n=1 Tax=Actinomadura atramentaria TaxID=1990 RepID=UPI00037C1A34|nr:hypothetical protein [Actinomadura atramentaria]